MQVFVCRPETAYAMRISEWSSDVCSSDLAWSGNWGFVPFTEAEFAAIGKELLPLIPVDFIQIAELDGKPVSFMAFMPNINEAITDLGGKLLPFGWAKRLWRLKVRFPHSVRVSLMGRSEEHTSELQSLMSISHAGSCMKN